MSLKSAAAALSLKAKIFIGAAAAVVIGTVITAAVLLSGGTDTYRVLKVFELNGSAVILREGTGELSAYVGMNLESGDTLTVGDGSTMRISMDNDKYVLLDEGTVLELTAQGTPSDSRTSITLKKGTILNELTSSLSANSSYEVSTPKATMAVRGTSFLVSVVENEDGSYTITVKTFHGIVEVTLLDEEGAPTDKKAVVSEDGCVIVRTVLNERTGNPAEIDGISFFVLETEDNRYVEVPDGENPVFGIDYDSISSVIRELLLNSNDSGLLVLSELVEGKLRGAFEEAEQEEAEITASDTAAVPTEDAVSASSESPEAAVSSAPTASTTAAPTASTTAAPTASTTAAPTASTAAVPTASVTTISAAIETTVTAPETTTSTAPETTTSTASEATTSAASETTVVSTDEATSVSTTRRPFTPAPPVGTTVTTTSTTTATTTTAPESEMFTVSFVSDGVTVYSEVVESGFGVSAIPAVPEKAGYTGRWMYNGAELTSDIVITGNITVTAEYTVNSYTVTFVAEGSTAATRMVNHGEAIADIPTVPEKAGYTGRWMYNGEELTSDTVITGNIIVTAEYTVNSYTVTFVAEGSTAATRTVNHGETIADIPTVPEKAGYTGRWMYNGAELTSDTVITGNITVTAEYAALYTVTYILQNDAATQLFVQENVPEGTVPEAVPLPTILDTDEDGSYDYYLLDWQQPTEEITEDSVIYVAYELYDNVNEVKITDAGGTVQHFLSMAGKEITLPETAAAMENYEFVGWGTVVSGGYADPSVKEGCTETEDRTPDTHTTTYDYINGGYFTLYAPGEKITLTDSMRMGTSYESNSPLNNFKFAATYIGRECVIIYKDTLGNEIARETASYGGYVSPDIAFTDEEKEGYNLVWTYNGEELGEYDYVLVDGDMEIIAAYVPIT